MSAFACFSCTILKLTENASDKECYYVYQNLTTSATHFSIKTIPSSQPEKCTEENSQLLLLFILSAAPMAFSKGVRFNKLNWNEPISIFSFQNIMQSSAGLKRLLNISGREIHNLDTPVTIRTIGLKKKNPLNKWQLAFMLFKAITSHKGKTENMKSSS